MSNDPAVGIVVNVVWVVSAAHKAMRMTLILKGVGCSPSSKNSAPASVTDPRGGNVEEGLQISDAACGVYPRFIWELPKAQLMSYNFFWIVICSTAKEAVDPSLGLFLPSIVDVLWKRERVVFGNSVAGSILVDIVVLCHMKVVIVDDGGEVVVVPSVLLCYE